MVSGRLGRRKKRGYGKGLGRPTLRRSACLAAAGAALLAAPASGAELLSTDLSTPAAQKRTCHAKLLTGGAGYVQRQVTAPATGVISARLNGQPRGDWDLGVFDAKGRTVAGSAHFGNVEVAEGIAVRGQRLTIQACRRSGPVDRVQLRVEGWALPRATGDNRVQLVRVSTPTPAAKNRLASTGLDLTEHGSATYLDVVLHGADDVETLTSNGFTYRVVLPDLVRHDRAALRINHSSSGPSPAMPSGRTNYRRLPDYAVDMKQLAEDHPGLVRPITLPYLTIEGRPVEGIEITRNPDALDGKPVFVQLGLHHAREWPSGELALEWAYELVNNYGQDQRTTELVNRTRTIVVPVVNPDGFNLTREVPFANQTLDPIASTVPVDSAQPVVDGGFAYKRRNCRMVQLNASSSGYERRPRACFETSNRNYGVDPNRNYGGFWGGPGASPDPTSDTFWGTKPFSEPETRNVKWLVSRRQATTLITNHTYSDLILRPPGIAAHGDTIDEEQYRGFGAEMAAQNGYSNWKGYQLYDTTGTTEDWSYFATGGFGFTFEIGRAAQSLTNDIGTGEPNSDLVIDLAGSYAGVGFHPPYPLGVVSEWHGKGPHAGKGNREAYYVALESTLDTAKHSVIKGRAVPGTVLILSKAFQTATSPRGADPNGLPIYDPAGTPLVFTEWLRTQMVVPESGRFVWHTNPSTRPDVLRGLPGREPTGPTSPGQSFEHDPNAQFVPAAGAPVPGSYEERDFTIAPDEDNGRLDLHLQWPAGETELGPDDLDLRLYRRSELGTYEQIASSTNAGGPEDLTVVDPPPGAYRLRVENWFATNEEAKNWTATLSFAPPTEPVPGTHEAWSLRCTTPNGKKDSEAVTVDRGETVNVDLRGCTSGGAGAGGIPPQPKPSSAG
jgi:murein tripeptide amidase MpaA